MVQQMRGQQQPQDPAVQALVQTQMAETQRKAAKDQTDAQLKLEQMQIERERIQAQQYTAGAQAAVKMAADKERTHAESVREGEKAGLEMIKHHSTLAHQRDIALRQKKEQSKTLKFILAMKHTGSKQNLSVMDWIINNG